MKRVFCHLILCLLSLFCVEAKEVASETAAPEVNYVPHIHGTLRARWEDNLTADESRFKIRNARVSLDGLIHPVIDYYLQVDLCQSGTVQFLDGWIRMAFGQHWKVQAGQYRMPFGFETFRAPHTYMFSNRSYMGRYLCNVRSAGVKGVYELKSRHLTVEGGIFNPTSISDQTGWHKTYAASARAIYTPGSWRLDGGFMTIKPALTRINMWDCGVAWIEGRWEWAAEYLVRLYTSDAHKPTHSWVAWGNYAMPVKAGPFNCLSFQGRYDGMTDFSNTDELNDGRCLTTASGRQRVTGGVTLSYRAEKMRLDVRANYEKRWANHHGPIVGDNGDRATVELIIRF